MLPLSRAEVKDAEANLEQCQAQSKQIEAKLAEARREVCASAPPPPLLTAVETVMCMWLCRLMRLFMATCVKKAWSKLRKPIWRSY